MGQQSERFETRGRDVPGVAPGDDLGPLTARGRRVQEYVAVVEVRAGHYVPNFRRQDVSMPLAHA